LLLLTQNCIWRRILRHIALLTLLLSPAIAHAKPTESCAPLCANGQAPALLNVRLSDRAQPLCYRAYAVWDFGITHGALWSASHPTAAGLAAARQIQRV